jgi:hypothetical protein
MNESIYEVSMSGDELMMIDMIKFKSWIKKNNIGDHEWGFSSDFKSDVHIMYYYREDDATTFTLMFLSK